MSDDTFVSLYRRFRPGRFDEMVGQDPVVRALRGAVRDDRVSHAYLFSGPRGTGKTSSARILAKALNCEAATNGEPCGSCTSCREITLGTSLNVHELDAASNSGVDAMRDLVARAGLGTPGRWKVYIVDEVHMLSTPAANALLKTLEEPPGHVVFVLATTDPQKVLPTIRSRTQHLEFRLLGAETLRGLLDSVNAAAGLGVDAEALGVAVRRGRGSARDALSALDQLVAAGSTEAARPELSSVMSALAEGEAANVLVAVSELLAGGWGPNQLATELVDDLRQVFLAALAPDLCTVTGSVRDRFSTLAETMRLPKVVRTMELLGQGLVDMRDAPDAQVVLEIAMVRACRPDLDTGAEALAERVAALERRITSGLVAAAPSTARSAPAPAAERPAAAPAAAAEPAAAPPMSAAPVSATTMPGDVERRPSVGAVRRRQTGAPEGGADSPVHESDRGSPGSGSPAAVASAGTAPMVQTLDRDTLTEAWGDAILRRLPARIKMYYSAGRFVAVDAQGAQFALPDAAQRDRCAELVPEVEAVLSDHFNSPVRLVLVVDGAAAPAGGTARHDASVPPARHDDGDEVELDEFPGADVEPDAQASAAQARLLEAFPGASEVTP
jgi:DNA polymerase-3 subunit gamma/tau